MAGDGAHFFLMDKHSVTITAEALQRGHERGEDFVELRQVPGPGDVDGGESKVGLGFEKVIETAFPDLRPPANIIDAGGSIAIFPNQLVGGFDEIFFGVAGSGHEEIAGNETAYWSGLLTK